MAGRIGRIFAGGAAITLILLAAGCKDLEMRGYIDYLTANQSWVQVARLTGDGPAGAEDFFGSAVAICGDYALVGAYYEDTYTGAAYIFRRQGDAWQKTQRLTAGDGAVGDSFGWSVAISEDCAAVGAILSAANGAVYLFRRNGEQWGDGSSHESQKLTTGDATGGDRFGNAVGVCGDYLVAGAYYHGSQAGAAYFYDWNGSFWAFRNKVASSSPDNGDQFGWAVAIAGQYALAGAKNDEYGSFTNNPGQAFVFERSVDGWGVSDLPSTENWALRADDAEELDYFGSSVAITSGYLAVGTSNSASAYIYAYGGAAWSQQAVLTARDGEAGDEFGNSVAVSGDLAAVGAPADDSLSGSVYVFERWESDWNQHSRIRGREVAPGDGFGFALALDGSRLIVGAHRNDGEKGSAYIFHRQDIDK